MEPVGRIKVLERENARLRSVLGLIEVQGDRHNGEITRRNTVDTPESWAARKAYYGLRGIADPLAAVPAASPPELA